MLDTSREAIAQNSTLYDTDFYAWTQQQAKLIESSNWDRVDILNLVEEIESLGRQQRQELRNRLSILLAHLLKWEYQSWKRSRSWLATIRVQRRDLLRLLQDSPSLKPYLTEAIESAYANAKDLASGETDLPLASFPVESPYSRSDAVNQTFYPGERSDLLSE